jgi:hypothetical protein
MRRITFTAALFGGLALAVPALAAGGPSVKSLHLHLEGHGPPGPNYFVTVEPKIRVCAKQGPVRLVVREQNTGFDDPPTIVATNSRTFVRNQHKPCQVYTPSWRLQLKFFGIGIYKVRVRAIDKDGEGSRTVTDTIRTYD